MVVRVTLERITTERRTVMLDVDDYDYEKAGQRWINDHSLSDFDDLPESDNEPFHSEIKPYSMEQ